MQIVESEMIELDICDLRSGGSSGRKPEGVYSVLVEMALTFER